MSSPNSAPLAIGAAVASLVVSWYVTKVRRDYAMQRDMLDHPNERSSHTTPTPRGGGIGIVVGALIGLGMLLIRQGVDMRDALVLGLGLAAIAAIGWIDDHRPLPAAPRLFVHAAVAVAAVVALGGFADVTLGTHVVHLGVLGSVLAVLWIVWSINLFNFMDGIDGLVGTQAVVIFAAIGVFALWMGQTGLALAAAVLCASTLGFVAWNWPPAKIFMGDVGSAALGYAIAVFGLISERRGGAPLLAIVLVSGLCIADATVTLLRRILRGERPWEAHRNHAYQRLSRAAGGHRPVTAGALAVTLALTALAAWTIVDPRTWPIGAAAAVAILVATLAVAERLAPMPPRVQTD